MMHGWKRFWENLYEMLVTNHFNFLNHNFLKSIVLQNYKTTEEFGIRLTHKIQIGSNSNFNI